jgi:hypothetical protein
MKSDTKRTQAYLDACDEIRRSFADAEIAGVDPDDLLLYAYGFATGRTVSSDPATATRKSVFELLRKSSRNAASRSRRAV